MKGRILLALAALAIAGGTMLNLAVTPHRANRTTLAQRMLDLGDRLAR